MKILLSVGLVSLFAIVPLTSQQKGDALPPWTPGTLDIHHISTGLGNSTFVQLPGGATMLPAWSPTHPSADVLKRMLSTRIYPDPRDVFVVQFREPTRAAIGGRAKQVAGADGHVVIRVDPGGARYRVFVLDNTGTDRRITSVHGPYDALK